MIAQVIIIFCCVFVGVEPVCEIDIFLYTGVSVLKMWRSCFVCYFRPIHTDIHIDRTDTHTLGMNPIRIAVKLHRTTVTADTFATNAFTSHSSSSHMTAKHSSNCDKYWNPNSNFYYRLTKRQTKSVRIGHIAITSKPFRFECISNSMNWSSDEFSRLSRTQNDDNDIRRRW